MPGGKIDDAAAPKDAPHAAGYFPRFVQLFPRQAARVAHRAGHAVAVATGGDQAGRVERAGLTVVAERPWHSGVALPEDRDPRFRDYYPEDLAVLGLRLVAVPSPDALEEPENVVG